MALSDNGKKKMEALGKLNEHLRGSPGPPGIIPATIMPDAKPVNE